MIITLKTAERVVSLHAQVRALRADIEMLTGPERKISQGGVYVTTGTGSFGVSSQKGFKIESEAAQKAAFEFIRRSVESRLAACIRELNQLGAEVPHDR